MAPPTEVGTLACGFRAGTLVPDLPAFAAAFFAFFSAAFFAFFAALADVCCCGCYHVRKFERRIREVNKGENGVKSSVEHNKRKA